MRVFVLGGTGSIGSALVRELVERRHDVWSLARSEVSAVKLSEFGATPTGQSDPTLGRRVCELGSINVDCCRFRYEGNYSQWIRARLLKTSPKRDTAKGLSATPCYSKIAC